MAITRTVAGMWIFTQNGFFSIVRKGGPGLCVRARDLDQLRSLLREHLPADSPGDKDIKILETPGFDYPFRAMVTQAQFEALLLSTARALNYANFKNAAHARREWRTLYNRLGEVWQVMGRGLAYMGWNTRTRTHAVRPVLSRETTRKGR